ncbi:heparin-binding EGF-like growth factor b [Clupea harengus]|uniref:Proheparin-binding EGF-like growth factor n=1 Tax=Clupea harengus TaxID=7950 RepID=A0A6P8FK69_CLUHA|nr:heparin-binding EGF-like growth factor b [Clupea harengus]
MFHFKIVFRRQSFKTRIGFDSMFFYILVFFRLCSCASIDLHEGDTPRSVGTYSSGSDRRTTLGVEMYRSEGYETETDYRAVPTAHTVEMRTTDRTNYLSNPCLDTDKNLCIYGTCQYHWELNETYCKCQPGFSGMRCHHIIMEMTKQTHGYDLTTVLPIIAVALSILCLAVFSLLLVIRHQKKHKHDAECEEKIPLEVTPVHHL